MEFTRANALNPSDPLPDYYTSRTYAGIGEFAKALQFAEQAVTNDPVNARYRGNLGVMYYRNLYWPEAVEELGLVINGGLNDKGQQVEVVNLVPGNSRIAEYYFTYGLALARLNQCGDALQIAQMILSRIPADELAVDNANEIINRCQQNLVETPIPLQTPTGTESVLTQSPDALSGETPTPTP